MADDDDRAPRRARGPLGAEEGLHEGHYREILALIKGLDGRVSGIGDDAREARDASIKLTERLGAQDIPTKLSELRASIEAGVAASRTDLVNSIARVTTEMRDSHADHEARIAKLEAFRNKLRGAGGLVGWISRNAPWLIAIVMGALAAAGLKGKLP